MLPVSNGREIRIDIDSGYYSVSIGIRKANGWWATAIIPKRLDNANAPDAETRMLAFMNIIPKQYETDTDYAIDFAKRFAEAHNND